MAVPSDTYELTTSIDLGSVFGLVEETRTVRVVRPSPDVLDHRLEELDSDDAGTRRDAAYALRWFPEDGVRVVPSLVARLEDRDPGVREAALSALGDHPDLLGGHTDVFLAILTNPGERSVSERVSALWFLARSAPTTREDVAKALAEAAASPRGRLRSAANPAVEVYRRRVDIDRGHGAVRVVVMGPVGHPLPGVGVAAGPPGEPGAPCGRTDATGSLRIDDLPYDGRVLMRVLDDRFPESARREAVVRVEGPDIAVPTSRGVSILASFVDAETGEAVRDVIWRGSLEDRASTRPWQLSRAGPGLGCEGPTAPLPRATSGGRASPGPCRVRHARSGPSSRSVAPWRSV